MAGSFFDNFAKDIEVIHAKYSQSADGDVELLLSNCDLPKFTKAVENPTFSKWQLSKPFLSSVGNLTWLVDSDSSDDDDGNNPVRQSDSKSHGHSRVMHEDSSSSSDSCNTSSGWDSDCSGFGPSTTSEYVESLKKKKSVKKSRAAVKNSRQGEQAGVCRETHANGDLVVSRSNSVDLVAAIHDFRSIFLKSGIESHNAENTCMRKHPVNRLLQRRHGNSSESQPINGFREQDNRLVQGGTTFARNGSRRASVETVEPGCVFEKLFVRQKGSYINDMVEIAARSSYVVNSSGSNLQHQNSPPGRFNQRFMLTEGKKPLDSATACDKSPRSFLPYFQECSVDSLLLPSEPNPDTGVRFPHHSTPLKANVFSENDVWPSSSTENYTPLVFDKARVKSRLKKRLRRRSIRRESQTSQEKPKNMYSSQESTSPIEEPRRNNAQTPTSVDSQLDSFDSQFGSQDSHQQHSILLQASPGHTSMCLSDTTPRPHPNSGQRVCTMAIRNTKNLASRDSRNVSPYPVAQSQRLTEKSPTNNRRSLSVDEKIRSLQRLVDGKKSATRTRTVGSGSKDQTRRRLYGAVNQRRTSEIIDSDGMAEYRGSPMIGNSAKDCPFRVEQAHGFKEDSSARISLKAKTTPRRRSTSFHPYNLASSLPTRSPSLCSPLQGLTLRSPTTPQALQIPRIIRERSPKRDDAPVTSSPTTSNFPSPRNRRTSITRENGRSPATPQAPLHTVRMTRGISQKRNETQQVTSSPTRSDFLPPKNRRPSIRRENSRSPTTTQAPQHTTRITRERSSKRNDVPVTSSPTTSNFPSPRNRRESITRENGRSPTTTQAPQHTTRVTRERSSKQNEVPATSSLTQSSFPSPRNRRRSITREKGIDEKGIGFRNENKNAVVANHFTEELPNCVAKVADGCFQGYCAKKFCFNCSMDCS